MNLTTSLLVYVAGLLLALLEIFVPSGGIIGIGSAICLILGLYQVYIAPDGGPAIALALGGFSIAYLFWLIKWGFNRLSQKVCLENSESTGKDVRDAEGLLKATGVTLSALRPSGTALFEGKKYDVVSTGGFIEEGVNVKIQQLSGNRIVVKKSKDTSDSDSSDHSSEIT